MSLLCGVNIIYCCWEGKGRRIGSRGDAYASIGFPSFEVKGEGDSCADDYQWLD